MYMTDVIQATARCECGWSSTFNRDESFTGDPLRSAKQAAKGHSGGIGCEPDMIVVDAMYG